MISRSLALLVVICGLTAVLPAAPRHAILLREAAAAAKAGNNAGALAKLQEAERLRPDYPRIQLNLARMYASLDRVEDAIAALERLAEMGLQFDLEADPTFAPLKDLPDFQEIIERSTKPIPPLPTTDEAAFAITGVTGIIESCLVDPTTLLWYFGDVRNRCIWVRDTTTGAGLLKKFTADDDALDGVFKLALSTDRKTLWAATATTGVMTGTDAEDGKRTALVAIDFATGRVRARYPVPADGRKHLLGDFLLAPDGTIYATDSLSPVIWQLRPGASQLEPWLESDEFLSLQGIALAPDGRELYVADYANGIWQIDPATKTPALLIAPFNATFFGIDGLYAVPGGLLAIQNGANPQRILRLDLPPVGSGLSSAIGPATADGPTSLPRSSQATTLQRTSATARVLAINRPAMTDLALGTVFNGRLHFVGNSGWALFDPLPATPPAARSVTILSTAIE